jgi:hypothetical protein
MATIARLVEDEIVVRIDVELDGKLPWRSIYAYPANGGAPNYVVNWLRNTLPTLASSAIGADDTPEEQLYALLELYMVGERLNLDMYKVLRPSADGVWELRTTDTRVFGWFYRRDCFIAVFADETERLHKYEGLHSSYRAEIVRLRKALDIDAPKFIAGVKENDVLSIRS